MSEASVISLKDVRLRRGGFELYIESLTLEPGQIVGLVGANASGKTTLMRLLPGLDRPDSGEVRVFGLDPWVDPVSVRLQLGYMTDDMPVNELRIGALFRYLSGYYPTWDASLADELGRRFELDPNAKSWKLSKGEGTKLRLILAMAFRPRLLVLDEPATGLDIGGRRNLLRSLLETISDPATTVLISSHQLGDLERIADTLVVLQGGQVVKSGSTDELLGDEHTLEERLLAWGLGG